MSHEIESIAWSHATPWHGLGTEVRSGATPQEMVAAAGIDWTVSKVPLLAQLPDGTTSPVSGRTALVRSTDSRVLDVVGEDWNPVQNADAMRFFDSFVRAGEATMDVVGSLRGGRIIWGTARIDSITLPDGDKLVGQLLLTSSHQAGRSTQCRVVLTRVVCANTLAIADRETSRMEARFSHRAAFDPEVAREAMGLARTALSEQARSLALLQRLNLTQEEAYRILAPIYQPEIEPDHLAADPTAASRTVRAIMEAAVTAPGATPGTAWGLLNGATYWQSHVANRDPDARLTSAWTGTESTRSGRLHSALTQLATEAA